MTFIFSDFLFTYFVHFSSIYTVTNEYIDGNMAYYRDSAEYSCNVGYYMDGDDTVDCLPDGKTSYKIIAHTLRLCPYK